MNIEQMRIEFEAIFDKDRLFEYVPAFGAYRAKNQKHVKRANELTLIWLGYQAALNSQAKSVLIGWITDDYLTDKSATTYSKEVAERWISKGWDVQPIYAAPQQADKVRELEAKILALPRYSFLSPKEGGVRRYGDSSGAWIERHEVIQLIERSKL